MKKKKITQHTNALYNGKMRHCRKTNTIKTIRFIRKYPSCSHTHQQFVRHYFYQLRKIPFSIFPNKSRGLSAAQ